MTQRIYQGRALVIKKEGVYLEKHMMYKMIQPIYIVSTVREWRIAQPMGIQLLKQQEKGNKLYCIKSTPYKPNNKHANTYTTCNVALSNNFNLFSLWSIFNNEQFKDFFKIHGARTIFLHRQ